jgi:hypothetical protein
MKPLVVIQRAQTVLRIWLAYVHVRLLLWNRPLPEVTARLAQVPQRTKRHRHPAKLGHAVHRALSLGGQQPRCLTLSLIHYRLLSTEGWRPELVIGLPTAADGPDAHAWVEIENVDVGPPPGRAGHIELARYGSDGRPIISPAAETSPPN